MRDARRWLADRGVRRAGSGWTDAREPGRLLTASDIAHSHAPDVFADEDLDRVGQVRTALGLLDLLDEYWVAFQIRIADQGPDGPLPADVLWGGFRRRLEAVEDTTALSYSLWCDWFEDPGTAARAFAEVLGDDIDALLPGAAPTLLRRTRRVLACSGPAPWPVKEPAYHAAARLPALHSAVFQGLLASFHDICGDLEPAAALDLLRRLRLPADTPHLGQLRRVLATGAQNFYCGRQAWDDAKDGP